MLYDLGMQKTNTLISKQDIFWTALSAGILMLVSNFDSIVDTILRNDPSSREYMYEQLSVRADEVFYFLSEHLLTPNITTFLVWMIIGVVAYFIMGFLSGTLRDFFNTFILMVTYRHPKDFNIVTYWLLFLLNVVISALFLFGLLYWTIISFSYLLRFSSDNFLIALQGTDSIPEIVYRILLSYAGCLLIITGFIVLFRCNRFFHKKIAY